MPEMFFFWAQDLAVFLSAKSPQNIISKAYESSNYSSKQTPRAYRVAEILRKYISIAINSVLGFFRSFETGVFLFVRQDPIFSSCSKAILLSYIFASELQFRLKSLFANFPFRVLCPTQLLADNPQFHNISPHYQKGTLMTTIPKGITTLLYVDHGPICRP